MAPTNYEKQWGPRRWYVTGIENDPNTGQPPPDIALNHVLSLEGTGNGVGSTLVNLTLNKTWGEACTHPHPTLTRPNRLNEVEMKRPMTNNKWTITRSLPTGQNRHQIKATPSSGGGSWTATEG